MNAKPRKKPRKRWQQLLRRILLTLLLLLVLGGGAWYGVDLLRQEYKVTYDTYNATIGSISNALSFSGTLQLVSSNTYTAANNGTVRTIYAAEGADVKKGDKLLRLSSGETVTADFDGRINQLYVAKDDEVHSGANLVQLADFTHMKVSIRVDEYDIADVSVGTHCTVTTTASNRSFPSSIASINYISSSSGNVAYYTATAFVDVSEGVYPGMQVTITIPQEEATDVVILKADALSFTPNNSAYVFVKDAEGEMQQQRVEVGVSNGNYVEIRSGLNDGDTVYVIAKTEAKATGLTSLLSSVFGSRQINPASNYNRNTTRTTNGGTTNRNTNGSGFTGMPSR